MEQCTKESVGTIIERDGEILLIDRVNKPLGWAGPAGHVDPGETPQETGVREAREETGLNTQDLRLALEEDVPWNTCLRSGEQGHYWNVFRASASEGDVMIERNEAKGFGWFKPKEIQYLELEPAWRYFFEKLGIIKPQLKWSARDE